jgi:hypothetical protein
VDEDVEVDVVVGATVVVVVSNGAVFSIATADNELAPAKATTMARIIAAEPVGFLILILPPLLTGKLFRGVPVSRV